MEGVYLEALKNDLFWSCHGTCCAASAVFWRSVLGDSGYLCCEYCVHSFEDLRYLTYYCVAKAVKRRTACACLIQFQASCLEFDALLLLPKRGTVDCEFGRLAQEKMSYVTAVVECPWGSHRQKYQQDRTLAATCGCGSWLASISSKSKTLGPRREVLSRLAKPISHILGDNIILSKSAWFRGGAQHMHPALLN